MKRPWTNRTSLFARMSLLFGLLATGPLVISGIVLSLSSLRGIQNSGEDVAKIGMERLHASRDRFNEVARGALKDSTSEVAKEGNKRLDDTVSQVAKKGREAIRQQTEEMRRQGSSAVGDATRAMKDLGLETQRKSQRQFRELNTKALADLSGYFTNQMLAEVNRQSSPVEDTLRSSILQSWKSSSERRAASVEDRALRAQYDLVQRLQYPLRTSELIRGEELDGARKLFEAEIRKGFQPEILRVILVSPTGVELTRVPETEPEQDWGPNSSDPTRKRFLDKGVNSSSLVELVRQDSGGRWIRRVVHAVPNPDFSDSDPDPSTVMTMGARSPTNLVIADIPLENIVTEAIPEPLPKGMEVLVIRSDTGICISSSELGRTNAPSRQLLEALQGAGNPDDFSKATFYFRYKNPDGVEMQGAARYWATDAKCWTVVLQTDDTVFAPVRDLRLGISNASRIAVSQVKQNSDVYIQNRGAEAKRQQDQQTERAAMQMRDREREVRANIDRKFNENQKSVTNDALEQLDTFVKNLGGSAGKEMARLAEEQADEASQNFGEHALAETNLATKFIKEKSTVAAGRTAARMLVNSTWLIPLFLVFALFLATLTARSLVKPINQLVQGTQALAAGDYSRRISVRGDDELARLALAFNHMAGAIERGQTELQQSHDSLATEKARIEGIVQASPDGLVMLEPSGQIAFMNPTAIALLGLKGSQLPDEPFDPSQLPAHGASTLAACLARASEGGVQEYEIDSPQRSVLQVREVKLHSAQGRSYGRLLHLHDITRERVIDEMKSDFISLVSHELRTPLTSILGFSSYMLTGKLGAVAESQKLALDSIHRQAKRLSAIISDFLDISRIESGKIEMKKEAVPVGQVAGRVVEDLRPQANEKQVQVSARVEEGSLPLVAAGDEQRIAQVFTNLIGNALKFTEPNGEVNVTLARHNGEVMCRIADTGCGIPPDELEKVFDRFYQVEKVVTRKSGGTGLGLAIVKNIIEAHGGRVWIESEVGHGTQVSFTLPGSE